MIQHETVGRLDAVGDDIRHVLTAERGTGDAGLLLVPVGPINSSGGR